MHHRLSPREHRFEYGVFLICVDLDELDSLDREMRWLGRNRWRPYEFRDRDHLVLDRSKPARSVKDELRDWLAEQGVEMPADARVRLLTYPRVLGYVFNPVSFYFVESSTGEPLWAVAEVGNTFGELKPYRVPLASGTGRSEPALFRAIVPKHFYVSPFSGLEQMFDFRLESPDERLSIGVNTVDADGQTVLVSTLTGARRALTDGVLVRMTLRYPLVTLRTIFLIHWQALRLWWKGLPWHRKSEGTEWQRGVFDGAKGRR